MAKIKNIEAFCGFCNSVTKMELNSDSVPNADNKRWAKCKKCKQMRSIVYIEPEKKSRKKQVEESLDFEKAIKYSPMNSYSVGSIIFHESWDDFGTVQSKEVLSNGRGSITVKFLKSGQKKLLETIMNNNNESQLEAR